MTSFINPLFNHLTKNVEKPEHGLLIWDVDLCLQPSMDTKATAENKADMWELYERTDGGVLLLTGRTHQSAAITFGHDYAGGFEHYSTARFGHGHDIVFLAPKIDTAKMGLLATNYLKEDGKITVASTPDFIRNNSNTEGKDQLKAVFVEIKNTSIALVHTTTGQEEHKDAIRNVLSPIGERILNEMGLIQTHQIKAGNDAVEIIPKGLSNDINTSIGLPATEIERITKMGLGKAVAIHNFMSLFPNRTPMVIGDGKPDLEAMQVAHEHYNGKGVFVSNGHPISKGFEPHVHYTIDRFQLTWGLVSATVRDLRDKAPITKITPDNVTNILPRLSSGS